MDRAVRKNPRTFSFVYFKMSQPEEVIEDQDLADFEDEEGDEEYITLEGLLSSTLVTEDGDTVCSALVNIGRQLEMQNKIMVKLLATLQKKSGA
jgi:hypothetical protein